MNLTYSLNRPINLPSFHVATLGTATLASILQLVRTTTVTSADHNVFAELF